MDLGGREMRLLVNPPLSPLPSPLGELMLATTSPRSLSRLRLSIATYTASGTAIEMLERCVLYLFSLNPLLLILLRYATNFLASFTGFLHFELMTDDMKCLLVR